MLVSDRFLFSRPRIHSGQALKYEGVMKQIIIVL